MKVIAVSTALMAVFGAGLGHAEPITLWPHSETHVESNARRKLLGEDMANQRLSSISTAHFFSAASDLYETLTEGLEIDFGIPNRLGGLIKKSCKLNKGNPVVPASLQEKYDEDIKLFHCLTADFGELSIIFDKTKIDGLKATFFTKDRRAFYVDSALKESTEYLIYEASVASREGLPPSFETPEAFEDFALLEEFGFNVPEDRRLHENARKLGAFDAYKFQLAPLANKQYSSFHGNTVESVLAEIINCFTRVNGIYAHELAVFLELIPNADLGICLVDDTRAPCNRLGNSGSVINIAMDVLEDLDVPSESYDIGHVLTTGSGGLAALASLCGSRKASGTTGLPQPFTDVYYVDYVAHEIGHQLNGGHVFRDCNGRFDSNLMGSSAAEPGSASSIMGYAGICGKNNIQGFSNAYFNNLNQEQMRDFIVSAASEDGCGETLEAGVGLPALTVPDQCTVPIGNYFSLVGDSTSQRGETYFSWDRVDNGYEDFESTSLGAFRSWMPTTSKQRFLPNLHALNFPGQLSFDVEKLPTEPQSMTFRFMERRLYETSAVHGTFSGSIMGDFVYADTEVDFVTDAPLKLSNNLRAEDLLAGESFTVQWSGLSANGLEVEIMVAENLMEEIDSEFVYERDVVDLEWISLGVAPMADGAANVELPSSLSGKPINLMIKSSYKSDGEGCFFFDVADFTLPVNNFAPETAIVSKNMLKGFFMVLAISAVATLGIYEFNYGSGKSADKRDDDKGEGTIRPAGGKMAAKNPMAQVEAKNEV